MAKTGVKARRKPGEKIGTLTITEIIEHPSRKYRCVCDCGRTVTRTEVSFTQAKRRGNIANCGAGIHKRGKHGPSGPRTEAQKEMLRKAQGKDDGTFLAVLAKEEPNKNSQTGYRGVVQRRGKYIARIAYQRHQEHLGVFDTPEEAAEAYRNAKERIAGEEIRAWKERRKQK